MAIRFRTFGWLASLAVIVFLTRTPRANIIHVPGQVPTIRAGIVAAQKGDTVMVAPGTYSEPGNYDLDFGGKAITVRSQKGPSATVINCRGTRDNPHRAFRAHQGEDFTTIIQGFTIIGGYGHYDGPDSQSVGGGILCTGGSSPTIINCILYNNRAGNAGGGLCCLAGSSPAVINCTFVGNRAGIAGSPVGGYGGAIRCLESSATFTNCTVTSNQANIGGGMSCSASSIVLDDCEFSANIADVLVTFEPAAPGTGGGLHLQYSSAVVTACVFDRNRSVSGLNMSFKSATGGGIAALNSPLAMGNCTLYGNVAEEYYEGLPGQGAALYLLGSPATIANTVIAFNSESEAVYCAYDHLNDTLIVPEFSCTDIYGNELGDWIAGIADQQGQNGNFSRDPVFCDSVFADFHLGLGSPCIPDSNDCGVLIGAFDVGCVSDVDNAATAPAMVYSLSQNRPNPFNLSTVIPYTISASAHVTIDVYNMLGQRIRRLVDDAKAAGRHQVIWDGRDQSGVVAATGVYVYRLRVNDYQDSRMMLLMK